MKITFYGAARDVTGSKHLIETENYRILLDCGLHQGGHTIGDTANQTLPFDAKTIDCVILSHAHADHSGMLPVLIRNGFRGKIYCARATADIAKFILMDSAAVQEQDLRYAQDHARPGALPNDDQILYTRQEAENVVQYFQTVPYFRLSPQWTQINDRIRFKFYDAGHILGSAITYLEIREKGLTRGLVYTGDLGQPGAPILHDPELAAENADVMISEATYGSSVRRPLADAAIQLKQAVDFAVAHKSKIVVPAFALGRTQELIYIMHDLTDRKIIPRIPIYIDGTLTLNITDVFLNHKEDFDQQSWQDFGSKNESPLMFRNLEYIHGIKESKALNSQPGPFMIISSSGMLEGGRILHHLANSIENPDNTILITGYQAQHTLGRRLQTGVSPVRIHGSHFNVRARIITMNEFSAHADQTFLAQYINHTPGLKNVFLVHSELAQAEALKQILQAGNPDFKVVIPSLLQTFEI